MVNGPFFKKWFCQIRATHLLLAGGSSEDRLWAVDSDGGTSGAEVALGGDNLVVVRAEVHA